MELLTLEKLIKILNAYPVCGLNLDGNAIIRRVLTQSIYADIGTAVIAGRWYPLDKTIQEALEKGASVIFCNEHDAKKYSDPRIMAVKDPMDSIERFEKWCEKDCHAKRITITGSVGKTTTTGLINTIISNSYSTLTRHSMSNSHGAILRGFQDLTPEHEYWVQEVGGVQPHYIESSAYMLHSDAVVLTNIGVSHLDKYRTQKEIFKDKSSLERYAKIDSVVIINADDPILKSAEYNHKVITFSMKDNSADYYCENIVTAQHGIELDVIGRNGHHHIVTNLFGEYNAYNVLAAVAVGEWAAIPLEKIAASISTYKPSGMRQNMLNIGGYKMLVDCFNAEPKTVLGSAKTLAQMELNSPGRKIFITGHIDKLGAQSVQMHTELGHQLSRLNIDMMVFYAGDSKYSYDAVKEDGYKNAFYFENRYELDDWIRKNVTHNDITFYKSGQFRAALVKTIDHVYGTHFQNEQQGNEGSVRSENEFLFKLRQDDVIEICGYQGDETILKLPAQYWGKDVIRISAAAFRRRTELLSIQIPDSVVNIGQEAFYVCTSLKQVILPKSLKYIHRSAFNFCKSLRKIELPFGVLHIEMRAFRNCTQLKEIVIPPTVGYIGEDVFGGCEELVIVCEENSYTEKYAHENKLKYRLQKFNENSLP